MSCSHNFPRQPASTRTAPTKQVAGYSIGGVIGVGTYGEVRYGVSETNERVAVKIIDLGRFNEETAQLMRKEVNTNQITQPKRIST
jgi:hypothetical protein